MVMHNNYKEDQYAQEFGIKVMDQLTSVEARILPPPMVVILVKTFFTCSKMRILICQFIFVCFISSSTMILVGTRHVTQDKEPGI